MIKISSRLLDITNHLNNNDKIIDIGCDHGKLAIYLIQNNKYKSIDVSDNKKYALNNAIINIKHHQLTDKITPHLGDGLEVITDLNVNTVIISGMGTKTVLNILNNPNLRKIKKLVIQVNNHHYELRKEVIKIGFIIEKETVVYSNKHYYLTISFIRGKTININDEQLKFGVHNNKHYLEYLLKQLVIIEKKSANINKEITNDIVRLTSILGQLPPDLTSKN